MSVCTVDILLYLGPKFISHKYVGFSKEHDVAASQYSIIPKNVHKSVRFLDKEFIFLKIINNVFRTVDLH